MVELLIVIVVLAILATIGIASYHKLVQLAYDAKVDATLSQIDKAIRAYHIEGHRIKQKYYSYNDFNATPGGGSTEQGVPIFNGGGLGTELASKGLLSSDIQNTLKNYGPKKDLNLKNRIQTVNCGKNKIFIVIESYSGISQAELNKRWEDLRCHDKTDRDWRAENNLPQPLAGGYGFGTYHIQPNYKYIEIDL